MTFKEIVIAQAVREAKSFINDYTRFTATCNEDCIVMNEDSEYLSIIVPLIMSNGTIKHHGLADVRANKSGLYVSRYTCDNHTTTLYNPYEFVQLLNEMGE